MSWIDWTVASSIVLLAIAFSLSFFLPRINLKSETLKNVEIKAIALKYFDQLFNTFGIPENWSSTNFEKIGLIQNLYRIPVIIRENNGIARMNEIASVYLEFDEDCVKKAWESTIRVYENEEVDSKIFNKSYCSDKFLKTASVVFKLNISQNEEKMFFVYFSPDTKVKKVSYHFDTLLLLHLDEGNGTIAYDSSGFENDGILYNNTISCSNPPITTCPKWINGKYGKALNFDGIDDYVEIGSFPKLTKDATFSAWINISQLKNFNTILVSENASGYQNFGIFVNASGWILFQFTNSAGNLKQHWANAGITENQWYHIAIVFDDSNNIIRFYLNGTEIFSESETDSLASWPNQVLRIGWGKSQINGYQFNGTIDEVRIVNRSLSSEEIRGIVAEPLKVFVYPQESIKSISVSKLKELKNIDYEEAVKSLEGYDFNIEIRE
jgi:hypothetical protein